MQILHRQLYYVDLSHVFFCYSPALRPIEKDGLNIAVVKADLSFKAVLLGLPDVTESTKRTSGFEASEVCENFNALQCLPIDGDWRYC